MCMQDNIYGCSFTHHVHPHFEELREQPFGEFLVSLQYTITCILKRESGRGHLITSKLCFVGVGGIISQVRLLDTAKRNV